MSYRISTVSEMTGIPRNTLIAWERRYGLICPRRQANGYRFYSEEDVAELLRVKNALNAGLKISEAVNLLRRNKSAPAPLEDSLYSAEQAPDSVERYATARRELLDALVQYRGNDATALLERIATWPFSIRLHEIYFPVLRAVGDGWERGQLSVAQEHYASGILRSHLAALFVSHGPQSLSAPHAVCTTLPRDEHEIAALALSIQLSQSGFRVSYLGAKLPAEDLMSFCDKQSPHLVCISCITQPDGEELSRYLARLAPLGERGTRVVLGGARLRDLEIATPEFVEFHADWTTFQPRPASERSERPSEIRGRVPQESATFGAN